jgi:hypothetical protein
MSPEEQRVADEIRVLREIQSLHAESNISGKSPTLQQVVKNNTPEPSPALQTLGAMGATALSGVGNFALDGLKAGLQYGPGVLLPRSAVNAGSDIIDKKKAALNQWEAEHSNITGLGNTALKGLTTGAVGGLASVAARPSTVNVMDPLLTRLSQAARDQAPLATPVGAAATAGAAGGTAGDLAGRFVDPEHFPRLSPLAQALAGYVGGAGTGFLTGPKQRPSERDIRMELERKIPADWVQAANNVGTFNRAGSTTATLAEAFPGEKTGIRGLAARASGLDGGELLKEQLGNREGDLTRLGMQIPNAVGAPVPLDAAVRNAAEAATNRIASVKRATLRPLDMIRLDEQNGRLPQIPLNNAIQGAQTFEALAQQPGIPRSNVDARTSLQEAFLDPNAPVWPRMTHNPNNGHIDIVNQEGPQQSLSSLLLNIAEHTPNPASAKAKASTTIPKTAINDARQLAFDTVNTLPAPHGPRADAAGTAYLARKEAWLKPLEEGPMRQIAGATNPDGSQLSPARMNAIMDDPTQGVTSGIMNDLARGGASRNAIARALIDQKLVKGPVDYPEVLGGSAGSPQERQLFEMLNSAGADTHKIHDLMQTGRELTLRGTSSKQGFPEMRSGQFLLRPFRTLDMLMTGQSEKATQQQIAELLAPPTPEGLARLREIVKFDPTVRRNLSLFGGVTGADAALNSGKKD